MLILVEPTPTTAYIYYGMVNKERLLICCYHGTQMTSLSFYGQYRKELNKGKSSNKGSIKSLRKVPVRDSDYSLVEQSILTELENGKKQLEGSKQVSFYADVNLCFLDKFEIARLLMDDTLPIIFQVPIDCVLETTLVEVAKKASKYHKEHYKSKVTIRTKQVGSDNVYTYPEPPLLTINELSEIENLIDSNPGCLNLSVSNITRKDGEACSNPESQKNKRRKEQVSESDNTIYRREWLSAGKVSSCQISSPTKSNERQYMTGKEQLPPKVKVSSRTLVEVQKITQISQPIEKFAEIENELNRLNKRNKFDSPGKEKNNLNIATSEETEKLIVR